MAQNAKTNTSTIRPNSTAPRVGTSNTWGTRNGPEALKAYALARPWDAPVGMGVVLIYCTSVWGGAVRRMASKW